MMRIILIIQLSFIALNTFSQITDKQKDSIYIFEIQNHKTPDKVLHAEPLYVDLIRDLGARKGEKEWNFGFGIIDNASFDKYEALIEYEFAPVNRLGLEIELPFSFYMPNLSVDKQSIPSNRLNGLKTAIQWSFFVSEKHATSIAVGYINELLLDNFEELHKQPIIGNGLNPFLIVAKRWGTNFHTLIYTGPKIEYFFNSTHIEKAYDINSNFHYMIPGTRNFIGLEINNVIYHDEFEMTIRPQMRLGIADNFLVGIVGGIPINRSNERLSSFVRLIWEPGHRH